MNRDKFEALPEIAERIKLTGAFYCDKGGWYLCPKDEDRSTERFLDGAYYAFCEQEKRIEKALGFTEDVHSECWQDSINCIREVLK